MCGSIPSACDVHPPSQREHVAGCVEGDRVLHVAVGTDTVPSVPIGLDYHVLSGGAGARRNVNRTRPIPIILIRRSIAMSDDGESVAARERLSPIRCLPRRVALWQIVANRRRVHLIINDRIIASRGRAEGGDAGSVYNTGGGTRPHV